jgi:hypothetical protein
MNESIPLTAPIEPTAPAYKDRSTGLMIFGTLTILLGCLAGLLVLMMLVSLAVAPKTAAAPASFAQVLPAMSLYLALAVTLIWLGIGSILARRWARALLLIFSWSWLVIGIVTVMVMAFVLPKMLRNLPSTGTADQPAMPPGVIGVMMVLMFLIFGVFFVVMPAIWTFFYSSRHVKATCEARDGVARWTDACPLPVLAVSLWLLFCLPMLLLMRSQGIA